MKLPVSLHIPRLVAGLVRLGMAAMALLASVAQAQTLFWDANGAGASGSAASPANTGGTGTWNTASLLWYDYTVPGYQAWPSSTTTTAAVFANTAGTVTIASGASIDANRLEFRTGNYILAGADSTAFLNLAGATPTFHTTGNFALTVSANLTGSAGLAKTGQGTFTLTGTNSFTGGVNWSSGGAGTMVLGNDTVLGDGTFTVSNPSGGTIRAFDTTARSFSNDVNVTGNITFGSAATGDLTFGQFIHGTANQTITISNAKTTVSATSINGGTIAKNGTGALVVTGNYVQSSGALNVSDGVLAVAGTVTSPRATVSGGAQIGRNGTVSGTISGGGGGNAVAWSGSGGVFAFGGNSTWGHSTNNLTLSPNGGAALTWGMTGFIGGGQALILGNALSNGTVNFTNSIDLNGATQTVEVNRGATNTAGGADAILSGALSNGGLSKTGDGTLHLTGASTYTGVTTVNAGVLMLASTATLASSIAVNAGTLGGTGSTSGNVTIGDGIGESDSFLAPGSSPGTFTTTGSLSLASDATYLFELNSDSLTSDLVVANGVSLHNSSLFGFSDLGSSALALGTTFTVINNTSGTAILGEFANLAHGQTFNGGSNFYQANYQGGTGNELVLTAVVPEPGAPAIALFAAGAFLTLPRSRRKR